MTKEKDVAPSNCTPNADQLLAHIERECAVHGDLDASFQFFAPPYPRLTISYNSNTHAETVKTVTSPVVTERRGVSKTLLVTLSARLVRKMIKGACSLGNTTCVTLERTAAELLRAECRLAPAQMECPRDEDFFAQ